MTNSISRTTSLTQNPQITNEPDVGLVAPQTTTAATTTATTSKPSFFNDTCGPDDSPPPIAPPPTYLDNQKALAQESFRNYERSNLPSVSAAPSTNKSAATPLTVESRPTTPKERPLSAQDRQQLADSEVVKELTQAIQSNSRPPTFNTMPINEIAKALDRPEALRSILINTPGGSAAKADKFIDSLKDTVTKRVGDEMFQAVNIKVKSSQQFIEPMITDPITRKGFMIEIIRQSEGDPKQLASILQSSGISSKDASYIASKLTPKHDGSIDPKSFQDADNKLNKAFTNLDKQLDGMLTRMTSNYTRNNDRFLTDKVFELVKDDVLTGLNAVCTPPDKANTLGKIINEATVGANSAERKQDLQILAVMTVVTVATAGIGGAGIAGVGIGVGMSAMGAAPEVLLKAHDANQAQLGVHQKFGTQENAQNAQDDYKQSLGTALARTVIGAGLATGALKLANTATIKSADNIIQKVVENAGTIAALRDNTADLGEIVHNKP